MTRILLVDDEKALLDAMSQLLVEYGYEVTACTRADEVLDMMRSQRPNILMHDARMPGLDLRAQVSAIRRDPQFWNVPIILLTATLSAKKYAEDLGADDAIEKPFDMQTLKNVLRRWNVPNRTVERE